MFILKNALKVHLECQFDLVIGVTVFLFHFMFHSAPKISSRGAEEV